MSQSPFPPKLASSLERHEVFSELASFAENFGLELSCRDPDPRVGTFLQPLQDAWKLQLTCAFDNDADPDNGRFYVTDHFHLDRSGKIRELLQREWNFGTGNFSSDWRVCAAPVGKSPPRDLATFAAFLQDGLRSFVRFDLREKVQALLQRGWNVVVGNFSSDWRICATRLGKVPRPDLALFGESLQNELRGVGLSWTEEESRIWESAAQSSQLFSAIQAELAGSEWELDWRKAFHAREYGALDLRARVFYPVRSKISGERFFLQDEFIFPRNSAGPLMGYRRSWEPASELSEAARKKFDRLAALPPPDLANAKSWVRDFPGIRLQLWERTRSKTVASKPQGKADSIAVNSPGLESLRRWRSSFPLVEMPERFTAEFSRFAEHCLGLAQASEGRVVFDASRTPFRFSRGSEAGRTWLRFDWRLSIPGVESGSLGYSEIFHFQGARFEVLKRSVEVQGHDAAGSLEALRHHLQLKLPELEFAEGSESLGNFVSWMAGILAPDLVISEKGVPALERVPLWRGQRERFEALDWLKGRWQEKFATLPGDFRWKVGVLRVLQAVGWEGEYPVANALQALYGLQEQGRGRESDRDKMPLLQSLYYLTMGIEKPVAGFVATIQSSELREDLQQALWRMNYPRRLELWSRVLGAVDGGRGAGLAERISRELREHPRRDFWNAAGELTLDAQEWERLQSWEESPELRELGEFLFSRKPEEALDAEVCFALAERLAWQGHRESARILARWLLLEVLEPDVTLEYLALEEKVMVARVTPEFSRLLENELQAQRKLARLARDLRSMKIIYPEHYEVWMAYDRKAEALLQEDVDYQALLRRDPQSPALREMRREKTAAVTEEAVREYFRRLSRNFEDWSRYLRDSHVEGVRATPWIGWGDSQKQEDEVWQWLQDRMARDPLLADLNRIRQEKDPTRRLSAYRKLREDWKSSPNSYLVNSLVEWVEKEIHFTNEDLKPTHDTEAAAQDWSRRPPDSDLHQRLREFLRD